jgi:Family of unknown function (DUF6460)
MFGNGMNNFLGGSLISVIVRLIVISFVAGLLLETFGFDPSSLFHQAIHGVRRLIDNGFSDVRHIVDILVTGAMIVVPVWIVLRLVEAARGR